jgi:hypothetical protein
MLLLSQRCRIFQSLQIFKVYFYDVERAVLWQVASVTSFMKAISVFKEDSVQIPTQRSRILSNCSDAYQLTTSVRMGLWKRPDAPQCLADNDEDVRTSEQHRLDARSINIQQGVGFQKSTLFGKSLQAVRTTWQHVRTMSNISEYSGVPFKRGKDFSEDHPNARSSRPDMNLIKIELHYFRKDIAENRPDEANFRLDARQSEPESQQF